MLWSFPIVSILFYVVIFIFFVEIKNLVVKTFLCFFFFLMFFVKIKNVIVEAFLLLFSFAVLRLLFLDHPSRRYSHPIYLLQRQRSWTWTCLIEFFCGRIFGRVSRSLIFSDSCFVCFSCMLFFYSLVWWDNAQIYLSIEASNLLEFLVRLIIKECSS